VRRAKIRAKKNLFFVILLRSVNLPLLPIDVDTSIAAKSINNTVTQENETLSAPTTKKEESQDAKK